MNRRELLKNSLLATALFWMPKIALARAPKVYKSLTIGQIISVAWPAVKNEMWRGGDWVAPELKLAAREGRLTVQTLGPTVEVDGKHYPVSEISIPMVWTEVDERRANTEAKKIALVKQLIENAINSHDDIIIEKLGNGRAVASKEFRYDLGAVGEYRSEDETFYAVKLYTAIVFVA